MVITHSQHSATSAEFRIRRSRTGCATCKLRRKKCDERKPVCVGCERNSLCCSWSRNPDKGVGKTRRRLKAQVSSSIEPKQNEEVQSTTHSPEEIVPSPDEISGNGHELGAQCAALVSTTNIRVLSSCIMLRIPTCDATISDSSSRLLLQHFIRETANTLSSHTGTSNPFIMELLPIAMESAPVLHSVLALAGIHYSERVSPSLKALTWTHYSAAIQSVRLGISELETRQQGNPLPIMLSTLILCFIEVSLAL